MYTSASGHRAPGRSRHRKSQSDPGHSYVTPPYTVPWPAPARQTTDPAGMVPYARSPSPFIPPPGSLLHQTSNSPNRTTPPTPLSPRRSPSPQYSGHQRSSSRQGSIRTPQGSGPLIKDVPQPPRSALNVSSAITAHTAASGWGQGQGIPVQSQSPPTPTLFQSAGMQRHGSHHTVYQQPTTVVFHQSASATHLSHHSTHHHRPTTTHHVVHPRSRSRPPSAASHRYASSITPPVYGHGGSSATLNASRTSLNGSTSQNHHTASPPPGMTSTSHYQGTGLTHMSSESPRRSRSHTRVPPPSIPGTTAIPQPAHTLEEAPPSPPAPPLAANQIYRSTHRPALPANYDGQTQTRYVNMLLALDDISSLFNILSAFFTWILLAGFVLLPGTFASWKNAPSGSPENYILNMVDNLSL